MNARFFSHLPRPDVTRAEAAFIAFPITTITKKG
jgi:hypothetical protein